MHLVYKAKVELSERKNVVYYINSEDLLKLPSSDDGILYLRLVPEEPKRALKQTKRRSYSRTSSAESSPTVRSSPKQSPKQSPKLDRSVVFAPIYNFRTTTIAGNIYNVRWIVSDDMFAIFKIELENNILTCTGKSDSQVKGNDLIGVKSATAWYERLKLSIVYYLTSNGLPVYIMISTIDYECTVGGFVDMLGDLMALL
jgi:hypothetical protein